MIQLVRIDDRLLHGQVAYSWKSALSYEAIVIANDSATNDEIRKAALEEGSLPFEMDGIKKVVDGKITLQELNNKTLLFNS